MMDQRLKEEYWANYLNYYKDVYYSLADVGIHDQPDENIPEDIKIVVVSLFRDHAKEWLNSKLPSLDGQKPIDLLSTEDGIESIKRLLLRIPD